MQFDINDFEETNAGPFEWDVKRLVTSFEIAARANSFSEKVKRLVVNTAVRGYREAMVEFATKTNLDVWYARLDVGSIRDQLGARASGKHMKRFRPSARSPRTGSASPTSAGMCGSGRATRSRRRPRSPRAACRPRQSASSAR